MADTKISGLTALTGANTASGDLLTIVDVSDTTMAATGTNKKITLTELQSAPVSGGTANGVLYLNGSKVATSGTALVFDGTNLGVGGAATLGKINSFIGANTRASTAFGASSSTTSGYFFVGQLSGTTTSDFFAYSDASSTQIGSEANKPLAFYTNNAEAMRLTSTGLGIGTGSPGAKLQVSSGGKGTIFGSSASLNFYSAWQVNSADVGYVGNGSALIGSAALTDFSMTAVGKLWLGSNNGASYAVLDSSGNLGLGVTPSAQNIGKSIELPGGASLSGGTFPTMYLTSNAVYNSGWSYKVNGYATYYNQQSGQHQWYNAASGTAGNAITFTQAMTLDASGNLVVADTTAAYSSSGRGNITIGGSSTSLLGFRVGSVNKGYLLHSGTNLEISNTAAGYLAFSTDASERARIDSSGRWLVGTTTAEGAGGLTVTPSGSAGAPFVVWNRADTASTSVATSFRNNGTAVGTISYTNTATAYNTSSDYRLKNNPQPLTGSGAFIDALQPKTWNWKADGSRGVGFIAHEVQEVSPGSVVGEKDGEQMQAMEYGSAEFIANIVAELQSLRKRLADAGIA